MFVIAGFVAIGGGWYGMIRQDQSVDRQFPYLISGGAAGIALLLFGVGLLVIAQIRTERSRLSAAVGGLRPAGGPAGSASAPEPDASAFPGRYLRLFGLAVCAAGFASIAIGWNGAARLTVVDQQFPFLLSGGVLGVALVLFGVGTLMLAQIKTERQKLSRIFQGMAVRPRAGGQAMGIETEDSGDGNGRVLAGPSTFHRFDCPLVKGRAGLDRITVDEARSQGLAECRVCRPTRSEDARRGQAAGSAGAVGGAEANGKGSHTAEVPPAGDEAVEDEAVEDEAVGDGAVGDEAVEPETADRDGRSVSEPVASGGAGAA